MSEWVNTTDETIAVEWCSRPSHWPDVNVHDARGGNACKSERAEIAPRALLVMNASEKNGSALEDALEAAALERV